MFCADTDLFQIVPGLRRKIRIVQGNIVQPDDGVHWRADLVAHIGEEAGFCVACLFRLIQCFLEHLPLLFLGAHGFLNVVDTKKDPVGFRPYAYRNDLYLISRAYPLRSRDPEIVVQHMITR